MLNHDKMPGAGSVADTIEFMKQMWGSMGAPSMVTPTLSVEDLNKKIADLKTVASWLELNMNMLKATIQTMEVQSATLSTLQAMSEIMASREGGQASTSAQSEESAAPPIFPFPFQMWQQAAAGAKSPADGAPPEAFGQDDEPLEPMDGDEPPDDVPPDAAEQQAQAEQSSAATPDFKAAMANPNAWWNLLQEQFKHAVGNALANGGEEPEPTLKPAKARKRSENKTVSQSASGARKPPRATKTSPKKATIGAKTASKAKKTVSSAKKVSTSALSSRPSSKTSVVQSRPNKKTVTRKPPSL